MFVIMLLTCPFTCSESRKLNLDPRAQGRLQMPTKVPKWQASSEPLQSRRPLTDRGVDPHGCCCHRAMDGRLAWTLGPNRKAWELGSGRSCQALFSAWCRGFAGSGYGGDQAGDGRAAGGPAWAGLVPARQGGFDLAGTDAGAAWREQVA